MGCCFDSSVAGARYCFYKAGKVLFSEAIMMCLQSKFSTMATLEIGQEDSGHWMVLQAKVAVKAVVNVGLTVV